MISLSDLARASWGVQAAVGLELLSEAEHLEGRPKVYPEATNSLGHSLTGLISMGSGNSVLICSNQFSATQWLQSGPNQSEQNLPVKCHETAEPILYCFNNSKHTTTTVLPTVSHVFVILTQIAIECAWYDVFSPFWDYPAAGANSILPTDVDQGSPLFGCLRK